MQYVVLSVLFATIIHLNHGYRILGIFPANLPSHSMMYQTLMTNLAKRGHTVDVISEHPLKKPFPNYTDIPFNSGLPKFENNFTLAQVRSYVPRLIDAVALYEGNRVCEQMKSSVIQDLVNNPPNDPPYDLLITAVFGAHCYMAIGHILKVPVIGISTTDLYPWLHQLIAAPQNLAWYPSNAVNHDIEDMNFWSRLYNAIHTAYSVLYFNYLTSVQDGIIRKHLGPKAPRYSEVVSNVGLILVNSHSSINGIRTTTPALVEVGGLHINDDGPELPKDLKKWLDESEGFIYFSLGSMVKIESLPREMLRILYESFADISPVRVLMKIASPKELPKGLPSNIRTMKWLPQTTVLKHPKIRAFITHGGNFGTQEAIYYGVPMIGIPIFADQMRNVHAGVKKNFSIFLNIDTFTKQELSTALKNILHDPIYRKSAKHVSASFKDRIQSPMDTACYWTEYIIRHGSKAVRSPAMDMPWWKEELIDVYIFLISSVSIVLYLLYYVLRAVLHKLFTKKKSSTLKKVN